jgi:dethiobiotin synthetase
MCEPIFITGIGTGVGKTLVAAIAAEALEADYWKPIQAGFDEGTDSEWVQAYISNTKSSIRPEVYKLKKPASPHIAAREEGLTISVEKILQQIPTKNSNLIVEGAGGLMVPLNNHFFVANLIQQLQAKVLLVSRNYMGSINHSLLTAASCKQAGIPVLGWVFTDSYLSYEEEIVAWTGYPKLLSIPFTETIDKVFICQQAAHLKKQLQGLC